MLLYKTDHNPNDDVGGGGCVCSPTKDRDCQPPYVVFPGNEMESNLSPHVVICRKCAEAALREMDEEVVDAEVVENEE